MISDERGCFWCECRDGFVCNAELIDFSQELSNMGWEIAEESLKKPLSDNFIDKDEYETKFNRTYTREHCLGCECSMFKRKQTEFVFR